MTQYNKKQEECILGWGHTIVDYPCDAGKEQAEALKDFLKEFNDIDPAPDPLPTYRVVTSNDNPVRLSNVSEEQAQRYVRGLIGDLDIDRIELLSFAPNILRWTNKQGKTIEYIVEEE